MLLEQAVYAMPVLSAIVGVRVPSVGQAFAHFGIFVFSGVTLVMTILIVVIANRPTITIHSLRPITQHLNWVIQFLDVSLYKYNSTPSK